eukprot:17121-Heterococcus_DN1.PRE.4
MASALSNITAELCLVAGDCSKKNLVAWQGNGRIIEAKHIRKAVKEEPKLANIMSILSARDRTPELHLIVNCDQVSRVNASCWSIGSSTACAINDIPILNYLFVLTLYTYAQQGLDLQLEQETAEDAPHLCGDILLRNPTDSIIAFQVGATQSSLYTTTKRMGAVSPGSETCVKLRIAADSTDKDEDMDIDDLVAAISCASSHTFVVQTATMQPTATRSEYIGDDIRQQEFRYS